MPSHIAQAVEIDSGSGDLFDPPRNESLASLPSRCTAHSKQTGERCKKTPIPGGFVCRYHGGNAPQVLEVAAHRLRQIRDHAAESLLEQVAERGDLMDPKVLLDIVTKLTKQVELLEGRATSRTESMNDRADEFRQIIRERLEAISSRNAKPLPDHVQVDRLE